MPHARQTKVQLSPGCGSCSSRTTGTGSMPTIYWVGPTPARPLQGCVHHPLVHESADLALPCVRAEGVRGESIANLLRFGGYHLPGLALPAGRDDRLHGRFALRGNPKHSPSLRRKRAVCLTASDRAPRAKSSARQGCVDEGRPSVFERVKDVGWVRESGFPWHRRPLPRSRPPARASFEIPQGRLQAPRFAFRRARHRAPSPVHPAVAVAGRHPSLGER